MKNIIKKRISISVLFTLILLPTFFLPLLQFSTIFFEKNEPTLRTSSSGVSNYYIGHNVTYEILLNFTLTHNTHPAKGNSTYYVKWSRIDDRDLNATLTPYCPPYQDSELLYNSITAEGVSMSNFTIDNGHIDKFNNTFDNITVNLAKGQSLHINQKYHTNLNEIYFSGITDADIGLTTPQYIYDLYNVSEQYYDCSDPDLINAANTLSGIIAGDNDIEKAQKIFTWVSSYLTYDATGPAQEVGASQAYDAGKGDCSEFSSLMITLLRIQGIPARKMQGDVITLNPNIEPIVGTTWTYRKDTESAISTFNGHAWVEYYVPNIGWIACDPTWHSNYNYFNRIDPFHLTMNNGAWFDLHEDLNSSELGNPGLVYKSGADFDYTYDMTITVIASDYTPFDWMFLITIAIILGVVALVALVIYIVIKKTR